MCGIVGIVGKSDVNVALYDALTMLQHRGQDAAGIMTCDNGKLAQQKGLGLVKDVFHSKHMMRLVGRVGIGHVRYPTAGSSSPALAQPFYVNSPYGVALAHNGNLTNASKLSHDLYKADLRHVNTDSDSEVLLNVFAHELQLQGKMTPEAKDMFAAVEGVHRRAKGGYAVVSLIANYGLVAFRDPNGIRPLVYGKRETEAGTEYMVASESAALDVLGFKLVRDVAPGEAIFITAEGELFSKQCAKNPKLSPCIFEHVYFARPDSIMDGVSVYKARLRQGERLADKILRDMPDHDIDVVVPIPDSSRVAGQALAQNLGVKFREGLVKNRYIGRTFIMPGQQQRNKVYFASAAPPVAYPNVYGIDMPSAKELIAHGLTKDEICEAIGADYLIYQDIEDLIAASAEGNPDIEQFDCAVFDGKYITGDVDDNYFNWLDEMRNDHAKAKKEEHAEPGRQAMVGIANEG